MRFILAGGLTRVIELLFSIRQGDPLAMLLYIVYIEPLLITLERKMTGLKVATFDEKLEAYCDDMVLLVELSGNLRVLVEPYYHEIRNVRWLGLGSGLLRRIGPLSG